VDSLPKTVTGKIMRRVLKFQEFNEVQRANKLVSVSSVSGSNEQ